MSFSFNDLMSLLCAAALLLLFATPAASQGSGLTDPDINRDSIQLIESRGFVAESYTATTTDGYILQMYRVCPSTGCTLGRPVCLLQHGVLDSSDTWLINSRIQSLAYILVDAGFDVFLGNNRGNKYSLSNTHYSSNSESFWFFTWDDMGHYDMPAQIDTALQVTGQSKLVYIGHSQGTTQAFANFATPSWSVASKVSLFVALAPVVYLYHTPSVLIQALASSGAAAILEFLGFDEFLMTNSLLEWLLPNTCADAPSVCDTGIQLFAGLDYGNLNQSRLPAYTAHFPSGTSVEDMDHWAQAVTTDSFQMYDEGYLSNFFTYGSFTPPQYDLSNIKSPPTALFHGGQDILSDPVDVNNSLIPQMPKGTVVFINYNPVYAHLDYVWGESTYEVTYAQVVSLAKNYSNVVAVSAATDASSSSQTLSTGTVAGVTIGVVAVVAIVLAIASLAVIRRRRAASQAPLQRVDSGLPLDTGASTSAEVDVVTVSPGRSPRRGPSPALERSNRPNASTKQVWLQYTDGNGVPYYFDPSTGRSQWEKPE